MKKEEHASSFYFMTILICVVVVICQLLGFWMILNATELTIYPDLNLDIDSETYYTFVYYGLSVLNMIMNYAVINRYIEYNPVTSIRLPNNLPSKKRELPSTDILKNINLNYTGFDLLPFFLLNTGCRKSEALAVRFEDIDFEEKTIRIHSHVIHDGNKPIYEPVLKTENAERLVLITDRLLEVLPKKFDGFLFSMNGDGKEPLTKCAFAKRWKSFCKRYNIDVTAHQLRHAYATMLFEAGIEEKDAQYLMGHSDIYLTRQIYTHIRKERLKKETAAKINNFSF